ncbi:hypothetical protein WME77_02105 [Sorangium sp. So ce764]|uniref:hypothetical protein n=1 Tax=Sorangium sp. So ce764 TaxID=3133320 RepID=UPI003F5E2B50
MTKLGRRPLFLESSSLFQESEQIWVLSSDLHAQRGWILPLQYKQHAKALPGKAYKSKSKSKSKRDLEKSLDFDLLFV